MKWHPHLSFDGTCAEAFRFYAERLGGKVTYTLTYGESPLGDKIPAEHRGRVLHSTLEAAGYVLTGADTLPEQYRKPQGTWLMLHLDSAAEAERIFAALAAGGEVAMPIQETFWTSRFGMVVDRFGTPWIVQGS